jgi:predicted RNase H-like HicB family nuclease
MKINIVYKKEKEWFVGHIQEYPDYESQGKTLEELKGNLIEIYDDITKGLVPDAEPFQILEVAI